MASQVCETLAFINGDDGVNGMEVMEINGALLMSSLMEESLSDEKYDDRLDSLMRSFEAEISSGSKMDGHDLASTGSELVCNIGEDNQSWNIGQMDGQDYWASSSEFGVEWVDMDLMPSTSFDDRSNWFIDPCGDEKDGMDILNPYDGFATGEHGYNSFWQDSYNLVN